MLSIRNFRVRIPVRMKTARTLFLLNVIKRQLSATEEEKLLVLTINANLFNQLLPIIVSVYFT